MSTPVVTDSSKSQGRSGEAEPLIDHKVSEGPNPEKPRKRVEIMIGDEAIMKPKDKRLAELVRTESGRKRSGSQRSEGSEFTYSDTGLCYVYQVC